MDETPFKCSSKGKKQIVVKAPKNVWSKVPTSTFHTTVVACANALGEFFTPTIIVPGKRVDRNLLDKALVKNVRISTSAKGWINSEVFCHWLDAFLKGVPDSVARPLVLVMDGYVAVMQRKRRYRKKNLWILSWWYSPLIMQHI